MAPPSGFSPRPTGEKQMAATATKAWTKGDKAYVTHAYDGSGVALRAQATILKAWGNTARIKFDADAPYGFDKVAVVPQDTLTALGTYAPLASFNFLD